MFAISIMSIWYVVIWPIMLGDATWQRWKLVVLQTWTPLQKRQKLPTSLQCFYSYCTSRGPEKMVLFLSCNAIFNKNSRKTIRFRPRGPFFVAMVLHVFTWISDRLFERLLLVWKQVLQLPCRLWWRCHVQLGCSDWDPYNSQLGIATSLTQIKRETVLRIQFNLRLEAVFFGCFFGFQWMASWISLRRFLWSCVVSVRLALLRQYKLCHWQRMQLRSRRTRLPGPCL